MVDGCNSCDEKSCCDEENSEEEHTDTEDIEHENQPWEAELLGQSRRRAFSKRVKVRSGKAVQEHAQEVRGKGKSAAFVCTRERMHKRDFHYKGGQAKLSSRFCRSLPTSSCLHPRVPSIRC